MVIEARARILVPGGLEYIGAFAIGVLQAEGFDVARNRNRDRDRNRDRGR